MDKSKQHLSLYAELEDFAARAEAQGLDEVARWIAVASLALSEKVGEKQAQASHSSARQSYLN